MVEKEVEMSVCSTLAVMRAALQAGNFEVAVAQFYRLRDSWETVGQWETSPWPVPRHVMAQLVELACREHQLQQILPSLKGVPLSEECINEMLSECGRTDD